MAVTPHLSEPQAVKKSSSHSMGSCYSEGFTMGVLVEISSDRSCFRRPQSKRGRGGGGGTHLLLPLVI